MTDDAARTTAAGPEPSDPALFDPPRAAAFSPCPAASPYPLYQAPPMELFDPDVHLSRPTQNQGGPSGACAPLPLAYAARGNPGLTLIPRPEDCYALWDSYAMLEHIRAHSAKVADLAFALARAGKARGLAVSPEAALAAGLLHDLGKSYCIAHGGSHAQLGAAWVMRETRNAPIARAVMFHVHWPWEERLDDDSFFLVFAIVYADKRVKHDNYVSLEERSADLLVRYGVTDDIRARIKFSLQQGKRIEAALSRRLGVNLHEHTADSGRLVKRT